MAKTINLSLDDNGKMLKAIVDDEDHEWLNSYIWSISGPKKSQYAMTYIYNMRIRMHHLIVGYPINNLVVDHKNGNKLDNTRNNLRIVTKYKNNHNVATFAGNIYPSRWSWCFRIHGPQDKLELIRAYAYEVLGIDGKDN